jgi:hypothetical protein
VTKEAHSTAVGVDLERSRGRCEEPSEQPEERRLAGAVRARDEEEGSRLHVQVDIREHGTIAQAAAEPASADDLARGA